MTSSVFATARPVEERRRLPLAPSEGWLTVLAAILLVLPLGWSFDDAGWIPTAPDATGYLPWVAVAGLAWGILGAKAGWGRWATHVPGAVVGALLALVIAGTFALAGSAANIEPFDLTTIPARLGAVAASAANVWHDLAVEGRPFTTESAHYHLWFVGVTWGTAQAAGYAIFGHRRPVDAIVVAGLMLLVDMAATSHEQLLFLILFTLAGLILLVRAHAFDEQAAWVRRRIGDPSTVSGLYLRGGAAFIVSAVLVALTLTATASSAPLQGLWTDLPSRLSGLMGWLQRVAPGGETRGIGAVGFGSEATTNGLWAPSDTVAFRAQFPSSETASYKWRVGTYAEYTRFGWRWGPTTSISRNPRSPLLAGTRDDPGLLAARREIRIRIDPDGFTDHTVVSPQSVEWVDRAATARLSGTNGRFTIAEIDDGGGGYVITALVPTYKDVSGGITENRLRAAGVAYPADILAAYLALPPGSLGDAATALLDTIKAGVPSDPGGSAESLARNPYDLVRAIETYLRDPAHFSYATDVRDQMRSACAGISTVECFARIRTGYCEYYASTMAVLLRHEGIPARIAYGFLGGTRDPSGSETVQASSAHWWVEVFFPGYGWIEFDPTGGDVGQPQPIPSGGIVGGNQTPPVGTFRDETDQPASRAPGATGGGVAASAGAGPFIAIGAILLLGLGILVLSARRRAPGDGMDPDNAWGSLARWARRAGLRPRAAQTVYEFAGTLGDAVPTARVDLTTVARAKVEVAYGRRDLADDRLRSIAVAYRRLRIALIRFALRPRRRRRG